MKLLYLLICASSSASAFSSSSLYVQIRHNHVCVFTEGGYNKTYENQTLVYIGQVDGINSFHSSYSKTYLNLKMPILEENCVVIPYSEFKENIPFDVVLETNKSYSRRFCLKKRPDGIPQLLEVKNGYTCSTNQYDYSSDSFWVKLKNLYYWCISLIN